jgi:hypothetical protein
MRTLNLVLKMLLQDSTKKKHDVSEFGVVIRDCLDIYNFYLVIYIFIYHRSKKLSYQN